MKSELRLENTSDYFDKLFIIPANDQLENANHFCNSKDTLMRQVIKEAQQRIKSRSRAGNIRSILTKSKNLKAQKK